MCETEPPGMALRQYCSFRGGIANTISDFGFPVSRLQGLGITASIVIPSGN